MYRLEMCDSIEKSPGEKVVKNQLGDCENLGEGDKGDRVTRWQGWQGWQGDKGDKGDKGDNFYLHECFVEWSATYQVLVIL